MVEEIVLSVKNKCIIVAHDKGYSVDKDGNAFFKNRAINPSANKNGYLNFSVRMIIDGKSFSKNVTVHRLQAYQKYKNLIFDENTVVRHRDGNKNNNSYENILIGTPSENTLDIPSETRLRIATYASSFVKKHNHNEVIRLHNIGYSYSRIMKELNIKSKGSVSFIIKKSMESKK